MPFGILQNEIFHPLSEMGFEPMRYHNGSRPSHHLTHGQKRNVLVIHYVTIAYAAMGVAFT